MSDYIPTQDPDFGNWVKIYSNYVNTNFAALGLTAAQNTLLQTDNTSWNNDYPAHVTGQATAGSLAQQKDTTRETLEKLVRDYSALMQTNTTVTDEQRAALGITIPKTTKTSTRVPATRPMANVDNRNRLDHIINFFDESTPDSSTKPDEVRGVEIWQKIGGTPPTSQSEVVYIATDTKTPYTNRFDGAYAGTTVHYMLRWVNTRNEPGPWSETLSVTISG